MISDIVAEVAHVSVFAKQKKVMNIEIRDAQDSKWAMVAWGPDAERLEGQVSAGHIYHFDGFYVQTADKKSDFTFNKTLKFTLKSNSVVTNLTNLGHQDEETQGLTQVPHMQIYTKIQESVDENYKKNTAIGLDVSVKSAFVASNPDNPVRWGALTDGEVKITTCVMNYSDPTIIFEVGERITAYGKISEYKEKAIFEILHIKDIQKISDERKPSADLRHIVKTPKKPMEFSEKSGQVNTVVKKLKMDDGGQCALSKMSIPTPTNN
ncbi:hypothetical protein QAD02_011944 [Eretmocerus hayati]|uniref:Uncharacterized protein n=1 Tax=Eretmocerus hayati TaxID=131215 RepID=A0ACC2NZ64_9HYME|nr:hypothetical protein QAD02_011944 [Eretmocerus hayati]